MPKGVYQRKPRVPRVPLETQMRVIVKRNCYARAGVPRAFVKRGQIVTFVFYSEDDRNFAQVLLGSTDYVPSRQSQLIELPVDALSDPAQPLAHGAE